jgi:large subunit ribosomal protein L32
MAVPKKKIARSKSKVRHSAYQAKQRKKMADYVQLTVCDNCGEKRQSHTVCGSCGYYKGREVVARKKTEVTKVQA